MEHPLERRVADLERDVAALKGALNPEPTPLDTPGFAEEAQPPLGTSSGEFEKLKHRVVQLEAAVAQLKSTIGVQCPKDWRRAVGWAKDDPGYDEAMRLGAEWRRRENLKSIRELDRGGETDADPGHRSSQRPGPGRKMRK